MSAEHARARGVGAAARGPERRRRVGRGASAQLGAGLAARVAPARLGPHPVRAGPCLRASRWHVRIPILQYDTKYLRLPLHQVSLWQSASPIAAALIPLVSTTRT